MKIGLTSDEHSLLALSMLGFWKIKPRLVSIPGVAHVATWGQREQQIQVQVDPQRLIDNGIKLMDIVRSVGDATWVTTLPFIRKTLGV